MRIVENDNIDTSSKSIKKINYILLQLDLTTKENNNNNNLPLRNLNNGSIVVNWLLRAYPKNR